MSGSEVLREQAAAWVVRLSSDEAAEGEIAAFQAWLDSDPGARRAYDAALDIWVLDYADAAAAPRTSPRRRPRPTHALAAALAGAVVLAGGWAWIARSPPQVLRTGPDERRDFILSDGSHVVLAADSLVTVRMGLDLRRAVMGHGDAVFRTASQVVRPFTVVAGDDAMHGAGAVFGVHRRDGRLQVVVRQGDVAVGPARGDIGPRVRLSAGSELNHREGTQTFQVGAATPEKGYPW